MKIPPNLKTQPLPTVPNCCESTQNCGQVWWLLLGVTLLCSLRDVFLVLFLTGLAGGLIRALKTPPFLLLLMFSAVNTFCPQDNNSFKERRVVEGIRKKMVAFKACFHFTESCNHRLKGNNPRYSLTWFSVISRSLAERELVEMGCNIGAIFFHLHLGEINELKSTDFHGFMCDYY